jgi:1-acyl-sn-glycerol-3-phosphate acyltransferase
MANPDDGPVTPGIRAVENPPEDTPISLEDLQRLVAELETLVQRIKAANPDYKEPAYSKERLAELLDERMDEISSKFNRPVYEKVRNYVQEDMLDPDTWRGLWYMLNYYLEYQEDRIRRRWRGEYFTDEWGFDPEVVDSIFPILNFLYEKYWRVQVSGIENIPAEGRAILVSNHSGQLPWDGAMIAMAVQKEHPDSRLVRSLYARMFPVIPFLSSLLLKMGQTLADEENGIRLLQNEELVLVFPEGIKGISKLYKDRYRLARFGRGGFVKMAIKTGAPIIPVSVVGAEETYIALRRMPFLSQLTGYPIPPISLRWPWLGPLGLVPLPTKWYIDFGEQVPMEAYVPDESENLILVTQITNQIRNEIQSMVYKRLSLRQSIFFGK